MKLAAVLSLCTFAMLLPSISLADEQDRAARIAECTNKHPSAISTGFAALDAQWNVGASVTAQLMRYNLSSDKASINTPGLGAGIAFRWYPTGWMAPDGPKDIREIKADCRATTLEATSIDDDPKKGKIAFPFLSRRAPTSAFSPLWSWDSFVT